MRGVLALLLWCASLHAAAQGFPAKAVHLVVPYPAGGSADFLARTLDDQLSGLWGQPMVVENKPDDVVFVPSIPHTATGKISKLELRKQLAGYRPSALA